MMATLGRWSSRLVAVALTHAHWDHVGDAAALSQAAGVAVLLAREERALLALAPVYAAQVDGIALAAPSHVRTYDAAEEQLRAIGLQVLAVPGHTKGSVALRFGPFLFTGDALLRERIGGATRPFGDVAAVERSLAALADAIRPEDQLLPGHGSAWNGTDARAWLHARTAIDAGTTGLIGQQPTPLVR